LTLEKTFESRRYANNELIAYLKKKRDHNRMRLEVEKKNNILAHLTIEEKKLKSSIHSSN
jgi:hypothetical protein